MLTEALSEPSLNSIWLWGFTDRHTWVKNNLVQYHSAASAAPCVSLLPVSHIAESAGDEMEVIILPPALPPTVPSAAARTKKKRKKAAAPAVTAASSRDALTTFSGSTLVKHGFLLP
jgi:hypothetical protein